MIYHDRIGVFQASDVNPDRDFGQVPADVQPINSVAVGQPVTGEVIVTRYLVICGFDFIGRKVPPSEARITYMGETLAIEGGFERHVVLGRFHHTEFVVSAFG